jgi:UDP-4-amino-4-deoxy-L-arabinose formyltransferase/UDP-glucuronic acid dehydrogenase (UDP-4-keto-hexauronic acid decarboxylating)
MNHPATKNINKYSEIIDVYSNEFYGEGYQDINFRVPSIKKAKTIIGWEPKVNLDEALRKTLEYYLDSNLKVEC